MTTAFVLSGGGSLAAVQVGMMQSLSRRGIRPDLLVGTSAGAINAVYVAGFGAGLNALADLAALWRGLRRGTVFPLSPVHGGLALLGVRSSLCSPEPLRQVIRKHLPYTDLEHASVPVYVLATDVLSGEGVLLSEGSAADALLASCAIPGVYPAVRHEDRLLADGALANTSAIAQAAMLGADRIYLLPGGTTCALDRAPRHPLTAALHAVTLLLQQRAMLETAIHIGSTDLRVIPPLCPPGVSAADFGQAVSLIGRARHASARWLDSGSDRLPDPERFLSLHSHRQRDTEAPVYADASDATVDTAISLGRQP